VAGINSRSGFCDIPTASAARMGQNTVIVDALDVNSVINTVSRHITTNNKYNGNADTGASFVLNIAARPEEEIALAKAKPPPKRIIISQGVSFIIDLVSIGVFSTLDGIKNNKRTPKIHTVASDTY